MTKDCAECDRWRRRGAKFCYMCGKDLRSRRPSSESNFFHFCTLIAVALVAFVILINTLNVILNFGRICDSVSNFRMGITVSAGFWDWTVCWVSGTGLNVLLALYTLCELLCLAYAIKRFLVKHSEEKDTGDVELTEKSGLGAASTCLCVSLFLSIVYVLLTFATDTPIDSSWIDSYSTDQLSYLLTRAGVREELMFRALWIGFPMAIIAAIVNRDKRCWQHILGGTGMNRTAFTLILISSILFGLAHNDSWGIAKVFDAMLGGIIFGYLYVEYGLYASIIAHTANDTIMAIAWIGLGDVSAVLVELGMIGIGIVILIYWLIKHDYSNLDFRKMKNFPEKLEYNPLIQWKRH